MSDNEKMVRYSARTTPRTIMPTITISMGSSTVVIVAMVESTFLQHPSTKLRPGMGQRSVLFTVQHGPKS